MNFESLIKVCEYIKKNIKEPIGIFVISWILWHLAFKLDFSYKIWKLDIKIIAAILIQIIIVVSWIYFVINIKKNKKELPGIGFIICSDNIIKNDLEKNAFFELLKNECYGKFNILIYTKREISRLEKRNKEIMSVLNLVLMFDVKERKGNVDNDNNYEVEIIASHCNSKQGVPLIMIPSFIQDLNQSISKHIRISHKNSLSDSKIEVTMFRLSSLYLIAILNIVSHNPKNAFNKLDEISGILNTSSLNKKECGYIQKNIPYRYLEAYFNSIYKILYTKNYYSDPLILSELECLVRDAHLYLTKANKSGLITKQFFKECYENYLLQNAIVVYERHGASDALSVINRCDYSRSDNIAAYFSKAFLLMQNNQIEESISLYFKIFKRKDIDDNKDQIEDVLSFINDRLYLDPNNDKLQLCFGIINYFKKDKVIANKIFNNLLRNNNSVINTQILRIKNYHP